MTGGVFHGLRRSPLLKASVGVHAAALTTLIAKPRAWEVALGAVVVNHLVLCAAAMLPRCAGLGPNLTRLPASRSRGKLVALTFDDGPDPEVTPAVLELLQAAGARATFFCIGSRAEAHPDVIAAIRAHGHGVENHTQTHPNHFALLGPRAMAVEVARAQDSIFRAGGGRPTLFRAPAGMQNPWLSTVLDAAGLSLVSWSRRGYDTVTRTAARVTARLVRGLAPGDILLLHDGSSARHASGRAVVLEVLPRVLDALKRRGFESEALNRALAGGD